MGHPNHQKQPTLRQITVSSAPSRVYGEDAYGMICFHRIKAAPIPDELGVLVHRISQRVAKLLERQAFLEQGTQNSYLALQNSNDEVMQQIYGHSITYRIAI